MFSTRQTTEKKADLVSQFAAQAREYHRRGDVVLRAQAEKNLMDAAPTVAYGRKVIADLYGPAK